MSAPRSACARWTSAAPLGVWHTSAVVVTLFLVFGGRGAFAAVRVQIRDAQGRPGDTVTIAVTLTTDGSELVAAVEHEIVFDPLRIPVDVGADGRPACTVDASIDKEATLFGFGPPGCDPARDGCDVIRAVVISIRNTFLIASGSLLYTCRLRIAPDTAPGRYALLNVNAGYADPLGRDRSAVAVSGTVTVLDANVATPTISPSSTPTPAAPTPGPTATPLTGDADCDRVLTATDIRATLKTLFGSATACAPDCNRDGRVTAADIACVAAQLAAAHGQIMEVE